MASCAERCETAAPFAIHSASAKIERAEFPVQRNVIVLLDAPRNFFASGARYVKQAGSEQF
jgi:hypothetical protein